MKHAGETDKLETLCLINESESEEIWNCSAGAAGASASSGAASCEACNGACGGACSGACSGEQPPELFVKEDGAAAASASAGGAGARDSRLDASRDVKGCFHRDVKLENIIVTGDFDAKIMDYGSLKFTDEFNGKTFTPWQGMFVFTRSTPKSPIFLLFSAHSFAWLRGDRGFIRFCR
jgi:hypothetical protein